LEEYSKYIPITLPFFDVIRAVNEQQQQPQQNKKKISKFYEEGLDHAQSRGMKYMTAIIHHLIGNSLNIRDDPTTTAEKVKHKECALEFFIRLNVAETQLLWQI